MDVIRVKNITAALLLGIGFYKLWRIYRHYMGTAYERDGHSDCLFFTPKQARCTMKCKTNDRNNGSTHPCNGCNLKKLISILSEAKSHIDICMNLITSEEMCQIIIHLFKSGICIRIILDKHMLEDAFGAKVVVFCKEYIPVKIIQSYDVMHNKFAIIDKTIVVTGSVNWTRQGFTGNYENILVICDYNIAQRYSNYFELLWTIKDDIFHESKLCSRTA